MFLLDCTLRDGANIVGSGFSAELTCMMIEGLIKSNIKVIEIGNAMGMGMDQDKAPLTDAQYLDLIQPYLNQAEIGMFIGVKNTSPENIGLAASKNLHFLRVGANAGDGQQAETGIRLIKASGLRARYSLMKGYILSADDLAVEAARLEGYGLDEITIMDSAGTMLPAQVTEYISKMVAKVSIPVGFHGHNNLGLSVANAIAAEQAGASVLDCGLMGMARSAGNLATELATAVMQTNGKLGNVDLFGLLGFIDNELAPAMKAYGYQAAITPADIVLGYSGCHSSFYKSFEKVAREMEVDLYRLIVEVSRIDRKAPSLELMRQTATKMKSA